MGRMARVLQQFLRCEDGPTAVEYAMMLVLIVVVCLVAITSVGIRTSTKFGEVAASLGGTGW
jgi:pilus assembly protein Flp/PilA